MNNVRKQILINLQAALVECNLADVDDSCEEYHNDLPCNVSRQDSAYGHISNAIREIGGDDMVEFWINNGYFE